MRLHKTRASGSGAACRSAAVCRHRFMDDDEFEAIIAQAKKDDNERRRKAQKRGSGGDVQTVTEVGQMEKALKRGVAPTNIGFQMLKKMGFDGTVGAPTRSTQAVPLPIVLRRRGAGLGVEEEERRVAESELERLRSLEHTDADAFQAHTRARREEARKRRQFGAALRVAHELDAADPDALSAWHALYETRLARTDDERAELNALEEVPENLDRCVAYLRVRHTYCFFCGVRYESDADLEASCPGPNEDDH